MLIYEWKLPYLEKDTNVTDKLYYLKLHCDKKQTQKPLVMVDAGFVQNVDIGRCKTSYKMISTMPGPQLYPKIT